MDFRRLEIFARVAELGSFSRAPESLFLTQPTVSEQIRALEDELGVQLLDRLGHGSSPTRAGELLVGYAKRILALDVKLVRRWISFRDGCGANWSSGAAPFPGNTCSRRSSASSNDSILALIESDVMGRPRGGPD